MPGALPLPYPYLPGQAEPGSFEDRVQQNFDALAAAVGQVAQYSPPIFVGATGAPAFQTSWVNFGGTAGNVRPPLSFFKDSIGIVHMQGSVKSGTGTIFTFPPGYVPAKGADDVHFPVASFTGSAWTPGVVSIIDGNVSMSLGSNFLLALDGITFRAEQ